MQYIVIRYIVVHTDNLESGNRVNIIDMRNKSDKKIQLSDVVYSLIPSNFTMQKVSDGWQFTSQHLCLICPFPVGLEVTYSHGKWSKIMYNLPQSSIINPICNLAHACFRMVEYADGGVNIATVYYKNLPKPVLGTVWFAWANGATWFLPTIITSLKDLCIAKILSSDLPVHRLLLLSQDLIGYISYKKHVRLIPHQIKVHHTDYFNDDPSSP